MPHSSCGTSEHSTRFSQQRAQNRFSAALIVAKTIFFFPSTKITLLRIKLFRYAGWPRQGDPLSEIEREVNAWTSYRTARVHAMRRVSLLCGVFHRTCQFSYTCAKRGKEKKNNHTVFFCNWKARVAGTSSWTAAGFAENTHRWLTIIVACLFQCCWAF